MDRHDQCGPVRCFGLRRQLDHLAPQRRLGLPATKSENELTELAFDGSLPSGLDELCAEDATDENIILVGESIEGTLSESVERLDDETYFDAWVLPVCESGLITIEMMSELDATRSARHPATRFCTTLSSTCATSFRTEPRREYACFPHSR